MNGKCFILFLIIGIQFPLLAQTTAPAVDQEDEREKLLHAADQLDNIQASSEQTRVSVEAMKGDIAKVQQDNDALRQENVTLKAQIEALQTAFDKAEANRAKERQVLLDEVAKMVAAASAKSSTPPKKKEKPTESVSSADSIDKDASGVSTPKPSAVKNPAADPAPESASSVPTASTQPAQPTDPTTNSAPVPITTVAQPTEHASYYKHIVAAGETLTLIAAAYRQQGVKVTVAQIRKANNLGSDSVLQVGQKLLIPKPPTN